MTTAQESKRTPLYARHQELGARMVEFAGWSMPVQYDGVIAEHHSVRRQAGLFDVSHMGRVLVRGDDATRFLDRLLTHDVMSLTPGRARYSPMCRDDGGILDDLVVYQVEGMGQPLQEEQPRFMVVVNAATAQKDLEWFRQQARDFGEVEIEDVTSELSQLAVQGPRAIEVLAGLLTDDDHPVPAGQRLDQLGFFGCSRFQLGPVPVLISRTGYTGEDGFELYLPSEAAPDVWQRLLEAGTDKGLAPAGLGARDTLRLEAGLLLYGQDMDEQTNPLEAGLERFICWDRPFIGRTALEAVADEGVSRRLIGFELLERGVPRHGYPLYRRRDAGTPEAGQAAQQAVGETTSGAYAPTLDAYIGLGYVPVDAAAEGEELEIEIRGRRKRAVVVPTPFYQSS